MREVRTPPPELAVQVVRRHLGQRAILAHVGWACTDAQLEILLERARRIPAEDQGVLDSYVPLGPVHRRRRALTASAFVEHHFSWRCESCDVCAGARETSALHKGEAVGVALAVRRCAGHPSNASLRLPTVARKLACVHGQR